MRAEIIAVGSELLTPDNTDTNSLYLTHRLNEAGCEVHLKTVVGDDRDEIAGVLLEALQRSDFIIFSGGLGPTEDDLTRPAVASVLHRSLSVDEGILEILRQRFIARGFRMAKINEKQAEVIHGAEALDNPLGTAPGMWIEENGRFIVLLPGPPRELQVVFEQKALPKIRQMCGGRRLAYRSFHVTGITESELDSQIAPIYTKYPQVRTTILAGTRHIAIRLYRWTGETADPPDLKELAEKIQETLGDSIFTTSGESMEEVVGRMLRESGKTIAVAESCTAGMLGMHITRVPGSSDYFRGGILCYSNDVKTDFCGVASDLLEKHGAVSAEVAEAMALGVRNALKSTIGLSITGIAGPGGGTPEKPVGLVYIGISDGNQTLSRHRIMPGDRESIRERSTYLALSWLRRFLMRPSLLDKQ
ncbi:MAG TPA: competence/damage-inducible protein A [Acidobacteriota bacterium]|nr:competence/damage-inducible protein A [Acidobacteriota bacterium]